MKKAKKYLTISDIILFFLSMFLTVIITSSAILYLISSESMSGGYALAGEAYKPNSKKLDLLFCEIDNNVSYKLSLDLNEGQLKVYRLYFDNGIYFSSGLSGMKEAAQGEGTSFTHAVAVTETQLAALIDYSGGIFRDIDERLSSICGGISLGYHSLPGISACRLFSRESENEELCLGIIEEVFSNWCGLLGSEEHFFKLLNLCENDFTYPEYIKLRPDFEKLSNLYVLK